MQLSPEAKADLDRAVLAYMASTKALQDFQKAVVAGDWERVEVTRSAVLGSMEAFMDNFATAYRV